MNVFVTGGSGFVGSHVIKRLLDDRHQVLAHARSENAAKKIKSLGVQTVVAFFNDVTALRKALLGQDAVVHAAAHFVLWGSWQDFQEGIVDATLNLHKAATDAGVKRFIYVSAAGVVSGNLPAVIDETTPYPKTHTALYGKAKAVTEIELKKLPKSSLTTIILRPPLIWGGEMPVLDTYVEAVKAGQAIWVDNGRRILDRVHVDNLAQAITLAFTRGADRETYFVTDNNPSSVKDFFSSLLATRGMKQGNRSLPSSLVLPMARMMETLWRLRGSKTPPPITRFFAEAISRDRTYDISKIKKELGYTPLVSRMQGLAEMTTLSQTPQFSASKKVKTQKAVHSTNY
jgi:2-alkyl-3-oxoalkanoate reductase